VQAIDIILPLVVVWFSWYYVGGRFNEVNQRQARLVLGWVTDCKRVNYYGM